MATLLWFVLFIVFLGMLSLASHDLVDDSLGDVLRLWKWLVLWTTLLFFGFAYVVNTYGCFAK